MKLVKHLSIAACALALVGIQACSASSPASKNLVKSEAFLKTNQANTGVVTLPDGLQYKILIPGKGRKPKTVSYVTVDYEGKLIDGTIFDSSYKRGTPATFPVSGVIPGWTEALQKMKEGATWMLYIPSKLAYGQHGAGAKIGPNEALIFKVHLIKVL